MKTLGNLLLVAMVGWAFQTGATDRDFRNIVAQSPNGQYEVRADSPDNEEGLPHRAFQSNFKYTCRDRKSESVLWERKQRDEGSPQTIDVSNDGWTVIWTGADDLMVVDRKGERHAWIGLLDEAFTKDERKQYVNVSTAGPVWAGCSLWYHLDVAEKPLYVIRPWWGRRIVMDLEAGKLVQESVAMAASIASSERKLVLDNLRDGIQKRKQWEEEGKGYPPMHGAFLAGQLKVAEAIPLLRQLETSTYCGSSTIGVFDHKTTYDGAINPHSYSTLRMRQVAQLSLRRLGETPKNPGALRFNVEPTRSTSGHRYQARELTGPRHANVDKVTRGMTAEEVLDLLGSPDFTWRGWEYDMDAERPFTLILLWNAKHVISIERKTPAVWEEGLQRDTQIAG